LFKNWLTGFVHNHKEGRHTECLVIFYQKAGLLTIGRPGQTF